MRDCYLGVDAGSTSIKAVLLDKDNNILESSYFRNEGIIETTKEVLKNLNLEKYNILSCGVTGSGRNFVKVLLRAHITKTEVLAHSIATLNYYPEVNTIFEIGGEDSKIMSFYNGVLIDFKLNNICGGGTGSMIEAIATRMGITIEEVGEYALKSSIEITMPGKCGIFCQSAVINKLNSGFKKEDILMGVCRALIRNYLAMAKGINFKPPYVFQGMTANNKALVLALEEELDDDIIVPKNCELMGAVGIAMMLKEENANSGLDINLDSNYETRGFKCLDCPNRCEVTQLFKDNIFIGSIGSRCGKWNNKERKLEKPIEVITDN